MKILIISQYAGSPTLGMVIRNYNWAREFLQLGHDCTIIAASYSHYRHTNIDINSSCYERKLIDGATYYWVKTAHYNGDSYLGRILGMLSFHYRLQKVLKYLEKDFDIVVASSPQPFQIFQAKYFSAKCSAKLVYDIRDLWPLTLRKIGKFSKYNPFIMALQVAENFALKHADLVTAVPQNSKKYLISKGMAPSKFLAIGNGYSLTENQNEAQLESSIQAHLISLKRKGYHLIGYCGALGLTNALHIAIESIAQAENRNIHLALVGSGNKEKDLIQLAKQLGLEHRVHFYGSINSSQIPSFLSYMDATYIGTLKSSLFKYGASPTKVNDYMAAAKPIIYSVGDPRNPVEQSGCGVSCNAEDILEIARAMDALFNLPKSELIAKGKLGLEWMLQNQTVDKHVALILEALREH